jgi:hypothetical protein
VIYCLKCVRETFEISIAYILCLYFMKKIHDTPYIYIYICASMFCVLLSFSLSIHPCVLLNSVVADLNLFKINVNVTFLFILFHTTDLSFINFGITWKMTLFLQLACLIRCILMNYICLIVLKLS